jgi:exopolyphosphatase / guanosine-5'-triphosphate,3'-diphosphate pyrophosphatase
VLVGVLDVGSNTMRLLVAARRKSGLVRAHEEREQLGLGEDVERSGRISPEKLRKAETSTRDLIARSRALGCGHVDILVTSPGRQAENGEELLAALERGSGQPARLLSAEDEARLAYEGALSVSRTTAESVAVVDVGGGSAQLIVGTAGAGPVWMRSIDIGSLRLTRRVLASDPPLAAELEAARAEVERSFDGLTPPLPLTVLATGGSARALRRISGRRRLSERHIESVLHELGQRRAAEVAQRYGVALERARTLPAGATILLEAQRRLGLPLEVARGGVREGAALALFAERDAAAA